MTISGGLPKNAKGLQKMTRRTWLILGWGILILTLVDGFYSVIFPSYTTNEYAHHYKENNHNEERLDGPVLTILIKSFDSIGSFIGRHEKVITVISTVAIAWFTATLWRATTGLQSSAERQISDMRKSLSLAEKQMALAGMQADLAEKQHELQRWHDFTTHRPKLIIRKVLLDEGNGDYFTQGSRSPSIQFNVANIGGSRATIIKSNTTFAKIDGRLPAVPPYSADANVIKCTTREAGQSDPPEILRIEDDELSRIVNSWRGKTITHGDSSQFYFFGYIQYSDDIGTVRRMAFCRRYNPATKRFVEINDPEYEYAD